MHVRPYVRCRARWRNRHRPLHLLLPCGRTGKRHSNDSLLAPMMCVCVLALLTGNQWFTFNDHRVELASKADVLAAKAYLLFYIVRTLA